MMVCFTGPPFEYCYRCSSSVSVGLHCMRHLGLRLSDLLHDLVLFVFSPCATSVGFAGLLRLRPSGVFRCEQTKHNLATLYSPLQITLEMDSSINLPFFLHDTEATEN